MNIDPAQIRADVSWLRTVAAQQARDRNKRILNGLANRYEQLSDEVFIMARNFIDASAVLIAHDKAQTAQVGTLTDANAKLATDLAAAQANAQTPETLAAQQAVIDAAEAAVPSEPPAGT